MSATTTTASNEPWKLRTSLDRVDAQLDQLRRDHYNVYVESFVSNVDLLSPKSTNNNTVNLDATSLALKSCKSVMDVVSDDKSRIITNTWLNAPSVLRLCFQQEAYEEALSILSHINLYFRNNNSSSIITGLYNTLIDTARRGRTKVLSQLKGPLSLAKAMHLVNTLRRLDRYIIITTSTDSNDDLESEFLRCRDAFLSSSLNNKVSLVSVIDTHRTIWTDIVSQFEAIFPSSSNLKSWASSQVQKFITWLKVNLKPISDCASLCDIIEQSMFFGSSLGRIGLDFRSILVVVFEDHVVNLMRREWKEIIIEFQKSLVNDDKVLLSEDEGSLHPVLAVLANEFFKTFNNLRRCTMESCYGRLRKAFETALDIIYQTVELLNDEILKKATLQVFTPLMKSSFEKLFH